MNAYRVHATFVWGTGGHGHTEYPVMAPTPALAICRAMQGLSLVEGAVLREVSFETVVSFEDWELSGILTYGEGVTI